MTAAEIEATLRDLAPDLSAAPLYVLLSSEGLPEWLVPAHCIGYTAPHLAQVLRAVIGARWAGHGRAIVLDDQALRQHMQECNAADQFEAALLGLAVHEVAHTLDGEFEIAPLPAENIAREIAGVVSWAAAPVAPPALAPWVNHTATWVRIVLHLLDRARRNRGLNISPSMAIDRAAYGLSPIWQYVDCLRPELDELRGASIAAIRRTPPPPAFARLWRDDVLTWLAGVGPTPSNEVAQLAVAHLNIFPTCRQQ